MEYIKTYEQYLNSFEQTNEGLRDVYNDVKNSIINQFFNWFDNLPFHQKERLLRKLAIKSGWGMLISAVAALFLGMVGFAFLLPVHPHYAIASILVSFISVFILLNLVDRFPKIFTSLRRRALVKLFNEIRERALVNDSMICILTGKYKNILSFLKQLQDEKVISSDRVFKFKSGAIILDLSNGIRIDKKPKIIKTDPSIYDPFNEEDWSEEIEIKDDERVSEETIATVWRISQQHNIMVTNLQVSEVLAGSEIGLEIGG